MSPYSGEPTKPTYPTSLGSRTRRWKTWAVATLSCCTIWQTGCVAWNPNPAQTPLVDQAFVRYRDYVWAQRAYNLEYGHLRRPFADHFRKGFIAGYCQVCNGGDGFVPATPPQEYWSYEYQSNEGGECIKSWFDGYPLGAKAAKSQGIHKHHDVRISQLMAQALQQEKTPINLPSDVTVVAQNESSAAPPNPNVSIKVGSESSSDSPDMEDHKESFERFFQNR